MRLVHFFVGVCLGVVLFLGMGLLDNPFTPAPACPHCAILAHPYGGCNEAVQGGWVCP